MSRCWKPEPIKDLKIEHEGTVYDKITYLSCDSDGIHFDNMQDDSTRISVNCKMKDVKITTAGKDS